jgi:hypothetical protein
LSLRRLALVALAAGVLAGVVVALAVPEQRASAAKERPLRFAPPFKRVSVDALPVQSLRIVARAKDPDGGPDWALREITPKPLRNPFGFQADTCLQLGRIARGKFGWVDASNVFRPARPDFQGGAPIDCNRAFRGAGDRPRLGMVTLISDVDTSSQRLTRSVVWGAGDRGVRAAALTLAGRQVSPRLSRDSAFIVFAPPTLSRQTVSVRFDGGAALSLAQSSDRKLTPPPAKLRPLPHVVARAPDPNGGLPWGVGAVPGAGGVCLTGGGRRIIGDRVGTVDFQLGTFDDESGLRYACRREAILVLKQAVSVDTSGSSFNGGIQPGDDPARGRTARRTQKGWSVYYGRARGDVTAITIETPHDVRTLPLRDPARAFMAVYDGSFEGGDVVITAHFADGTSKVVQRYRTGAL